MKRFLGLFTSLSLLISIPTPAKAAPTFMSLVCITNEASFPVTLTTAWHQHTEWTSSTLRPGQSRWWAWNYDFPNKNRSPWFVFDVRPVGVSIHKKLNYRAKGTAVSDRECSNATKLVVKSHNEYVYVEPQNPHSEQNFKEGHWGASGNICFVGACR